MADTSEPCASTWNSSYDYLKSTILAASSSMDKEIKRNKSEQSPRILGETISMFEVLLTRISNFIGEYSWLLQYGPILIGISLILFIVNTVMKIKTRLS